MEQKIELPRDEVVFTAKDGRTLTVEQVALAQNDAQWAPADGTEIPAEAKEAFEAGRAHGVEKRRDEALAAFGKARDLVPEWPHPRHDIAFVHLLCGEWEDALARYEDVDKMEPKGFFQAKTAVWALRKEAAGELPVGIYSAYCQLHWEQDQQKRIEGLRQMVEHAPSFSPAWRDLAGVQSSAQDAQQMIQNGIAAQPDPDTMGGLLSGLAMVYLAQGKEEAAQDIVGHLILDPNSTRLTRVGAAQVLLRIHIARRQRDGEPEPPTGGTDD